MFKDKLKTFFTNRYLVYVLIVLGYTLGSIGFLVIDFLLVETGPCFIVAWNVIFAWSVVRYYQKKWIIQLNKTRFFNLYLLLGVLIIAINMAMFIGPADFHSPLNKYLVSFISTFAIALSEEVIFRSYTNEIFRKNDQPHRNWKLLIIVPTYGLCIFLRDFLSSYFINMIDVGKVKAVELLSTSLFWNPILQAFVIALCFGLFLYSIYRKTNLSTCVIIHFAFLLTKDITKLSVSATYLPDTISTVVGISMLAVMTIIGIFFTLYKKKLPKNLEYEVIDEQEASKDIENK